MKNAHVAFFSFPYAAGVVPTLAVVATLVRRGYRVTYVTSDRYASRILELGAEFLRCPSFRPGVKSDDEDHLFVQMAVRTLANVTPFYEANKPDLIVYDWIGCAGRVLAEKWTIPAIQTNPAFAFDRNHLSLQLQSSQFGRELLAAGGRDVNRFFTRYGIDGNFPFQKETLNIYFYPESFRLDSLTSDESSFYAARCAGEQPYHRAWKKKGLDGHPTVLVTTSTVFIQGPDYFKMCIEALVGLHWHVVLAIGDNNNPASFDPLPPHFEIMQHIPQIQILPHANLLICLGGMIITMEAMYHGVPMLMITHGSAEAEMYAENFERLGLGEHLNKARTSAENIRKSALGILQNAALLKRVKETQRIIQGEPGAEDTANRITDFLESR